MLQDTPFLIQTSYCEACANGPDSNKKIYIDRSEVSCRTGYSIPGCEDRGVGRGGCFRRRRRRRRRRPGFFMILFIFFFLFIYFSSFHLFFSFQLFFIHEGFAQTAALQRLGTARVEHQDFLEKVSRKLCQGSCTQSEPNSLNIVGVDIFSMILLHFWDLF